MEGVENLNDLDPFLSLRGTEMREVCKLKDLIEQLSCIIEMGWVGIGWMLRTKSTFPLFTGRAVFLHKITRPLGQAWADAIDSVKRPPRYRSIDQP